MFLCTTVVRKLHKYKCNHKPRGHTPLEALCEFILVTPTKAKHDSKPYTMSLSSIKNFCLNFFIGLT